MKKPKLFVTSLLPPLVMQALEKNFSLFCLNNTTPLKRTQIIRGLKDKDGVISMLSDRLDAEVLKRAPSIRIIANYAAGYNNIDLAEAKRREIVITNTPDVLTEATADLTWALLLGVSRRLMEGSLHVRSGRWKGWAPTQLLGYEFHGKTLGIIGMGRIGQSVAKRALGFGVKIIYHSRSKLPQKMEKTLKAKWVSLPFLLKKSDFTTIHAPLTPQTYHLIGAKEIRMMKKTAILINAARGPIIEEKALVMALKKNQIAGAGFDVYEEEPIIPRGLSNLPNVLLLPHLGSATVETRNQMGFLVLKNLNAFFKGQRPPNLLVF